jgi:hypothetical protein
VSNIRRSKIHKRVAFKIFTSSIRRKKNPWDAKIELLSVNLGFPQGAASPVLAHTPLLYQIKTSLTIDSSEIADSSSQPPRRSPCMSVRDSKRNERSNESSQQHISSIAKRTKNIHWIRNFEI